MNTWESNSDGLKATAIREAGHALANLYFGISFTEVRIFDDESGHVSVDTPEPRNITEAEPFTICRFAGYAAEHVVLKCEPRITEQDWQVIWEFVRPLFRKEHRFEQFTARMERRAVKLMRLRRGTIVWLADALVERRRLTRVRL